MRRVHSWFGLCAVVLALAALARADGEKLSLDKVPKSIMDAIKGRFPGADVLAVEKEKEDGKIMFDVELKHEGRKYEMDIKEDGTIIEIEKEVALKDVPAAVTQAIQAKFPSATIKEVMEVNKVEGKQETPIHYEATIQIGDKKPQEVIVSLDGKSVKKEGEK
jgi:Putative beta-lactamase-inhibitor-like, PepSY-like